MADLGCPVNAVPAFDFLVGKGLSNFQAAGVIGNLQWESHLNPQLEAIDSNGLPGRGIAMWQPPRWQNLLAFAAGRDPWALNTQLDFLWHELPSYGLQRLLATTTVEDATIVFQDVFENPKRALAHTGDRIRLANDALTCLTITPPLVAPRAGLVAATVGAVALVVAAGYGAYRLWGAPEPEPEPYLPPAPTRLRPVVFRRPMRREF